MSEIEMHVVRPRYPASPVLSVINPENTQTFPSSNRIRASVSLKSSLGKLQPWPQRRASRPAAFEFCETQFKLSGKLSSKTNGYLIARSGSVQRSFHLPHLALSLFRALEPHHPKTGRLRTKHGLPPYPALVQESESSHTSMLRHFRAQNLHGSRFWCWVTTSCNN